MPSPDSNHPAAGRRRRLAAGLLGLASVVIVVGLVAALLLRGHATTGPLDEDAPALAHVTFRSTGCAFQPDRGGMVAHFEVTTIDAGRFTLDVQAVTDEGADDLDISSPHVVRYTVPFYGGRTSKQFDVVVPLTTSEHRDGYRQCRYDVNRTD